MDTRSERAHTQDPAQKARLRLVVLGGMGVLKLYYEIEIEMCGISIPQSYNTSQCIHLGYNLMIQDRATIPSRQGQTHEAAGAWSADVRCPPPDLT